MVDIHAIKEIDLKENIIYYKDGNNLSYKDFKAAFDQYWHKRIRGETIAVAEMERFMNRGSSKNLKQLIDVKKTEGTLEALIGKKIDPKWIKVILFLALVGVGIMILFMIVPKLGIL